jgi:hypothetical protein
MSSARPASPGKSRQCPHCKATILDSASVCPGCRHHLRFDSVDAARRAVPSSSPLRVEGKIKHPADGPAWEYSVVLVIRDQAGIEVTRQVVGVGALQPAEERSFSLSVEVFGRAELVPTLKSINKK